VCIVSKRHWTFGAGMLSVIFSRLIPLPCPEALSWRYAQVMLGREKIFPFLV
jgi:hypothetical protein